MTAGQHPDWCDVANQCTAAPKDGVPFSEGEHRSEAIPLPTGQIVWGMKPGIVTAYLTQRDCDAWETRAHLHIVSSVYGPLAHMPVKAFVALVGQLGRLVGPAELAQAAGAPPPRPVARAAWPTGVGWAATPPWGS